jgi:PAS domain S-box-containing protein
MKISEADGPERPTGVHHRRELVDSEERFRVLVDNVADYAIFLLDPDGIVRSWNTGAQRIKGYTAEEIIGQSFARFYPPEDVARNKPQRMLDLARRHGRVQDEGWRVRKDGTRFWANATITALFNEERHLRGFLKVTRDLTERREKEAAEHRAFLLQESSRLKDEFLAVLSHELRTPLNVIIGEVWRLRHSHMEPTQQERAWESLERNLKLQARIIEDLLDISRIESGKVELDLQPVDLAALISDACEQMRSVAVDHGVDLIVDVAHAPVRMNGDPARLMQVINNFLTNAFKFTPRGGRIEIHLRTEGRDAILTVSDNGIGVSPDFLPRMFDRFSQSDSSTRRSQPGLGVGLAIVKQLVQMHGGTVTAASDGQNRGTTFTVRLPIIEQGPGSETEP